MRYIAYIHVLVTYLLTYSGVFERQSPPNGHLERRLAVLRQLTGQTQLSYFWALLC